MANEAKIYTPGSEAIVAFRREPHGPNDRVVGVSLGITESRDGDTPATLNALPTTPAPTVISYIDAFQANESLGNGLGRAVGSGTVLYDKPGMRTSAIDFPIRAGCMEIFDAFFNANYVAIYYGTVGRPSRVIRYARGESMSLSLENGSAQEIVGSLRFTGITTVDDGPELSWPVAEEPEFEAPEERAVWRTQQAVLRTPLCWHDVRQLNIKNGAGNIVDWRMAFTGGNLSMRRQLISCVCRPDWGPQYALSRTRNDIIFGNTEISGNMKFTRDLSEAYWNQLASSPLWQRIKIPISNASGSKIFDLALTEPRPQVREFQSSLNDLVSYGIPITARQIHLEWL
jgi:hypothetical protein